MLSMALIVTLVYLLKNHKLNSLNLEHASCNRTPSAQTFTFVTFITLNNHLKLYNVNSLQVYLVT